jgi:hypothetical protein
MISRNVSRRCVYEIRMQVVSGVTTVLSSGFRGSLSPGLDRTGREAGRSPTSGAGVGNSWSCTSTPHIHLHGVVFGEVLGTSLWGNILSNGYQGLFLWG